MTDQANRSGPLRLSKIAPGAIVVIALSLVVSLAVWNVAVTKWQLRRNPAPGRFYTVEGRRMYIYCVGSGSPTLVIESGLSSDSLGWYGVQHDLARSTRVCAYDRSGLGLSEPRSGSRDAESIARQLHELLQEARVQPPYVPVGWSAGGLYVRVFARLFPNEIAGMVLVESSVPRQIDETPGFRASWEADKRGLPSQYMWERSRVWTGWERLMGGCHNEPSKELKNLPTDEFSLLAGLYNAKMCRPEFIGGEFGEFVGFEASAKQAGQLSSLGNLPLLIVTKDTERRSPDMTASDLAELKVWSREQSEMMSLSTQSWHVLARASGHAVHHERPDLLVSEIGSLISYLRGGAVPPFGTTTTK